MTDAPIPHEKHDLPSGAIVELLAVTTLKAKHYRQVVRAISDVQGRLGGAALDMLDGVLAMLVTSWTVTDDDGEPLPIPSVHIDSIEELTLEDYSYLVGLPVVQETAKRVTQAQRPVVTPDDWNDETSPTGPSSASKPRLGEKPSAGRRTTPGKTRQKTSGGQSAGAGPRSKSAS